MADETCPRCQGFVWHRQTECNCQTVAKPAPGDPVEFFRALGARLAACRKSKGLSLDAVAGRAGLSKAGLWQIEKGRTEPRARTLIALARVLDVTTDYLLLREPLGRSET